MTLASRKGMDIQIIACIYLALHAVQKCLYKHTNGSQKILVKGTEASKDCES